MIFTLLILNICFSVYFFLLDYRSVSLLPIIITIGSFFLSESSSQQLNNYAEQTKNLVTSYSTNFFRLIFLIGITIILYQVNNPEGLDIISLGVLITRLIGIQSFLIIYSYITHYKQGKEMFVWGYLACRIALIITAFFIGDQTNIREILQIMIVFSSTIVALILLRLHHHNAISPGYLRFSIALFLICIGSILTEFVNSDSLGTFIILQIYSAIILTVSSSVKMLSRTLISDPSLRHTYNLEILLSRRGVKQNSLHTFFSSSRIVRLQNHIRNLPGKYKAAVSLSQLFLLVGSIGSYIWLSSITINGLVTDFLYLLSICLFIRNYTHIKQLGYYYQILRVMAFFILSFGIYGIILRSFSGNTVLIVLISIMRNIINTLLVIIIKNSIILENRLRLKLEDYTVRLGSIVGASIVTLVFMTQLALPYGILIAFIMLYMGLQGVLLSYGFSLMESRNGSSILRHDKGK